MNRPIRPKVLRFIVLGLALMLLGCPSAFAKESVYSKLSEREQQLATALKEDLKCVRDRLFNASGVAIVRTTTDMSDGKHSERVERSTYYGNVQGAKSGNILGEKIFLRVDTETIRSESSEQDKSTALQKTYAIMTPDGAGKARERDGKVVVTSLRPAGHDGGILVDSFFLAATYASLFRAESWIFDELWDVREASLTEGIADEASSARSLEFKAVFDQKVSEELHIRILFVGDPEFVVKEYEIHAKRLETGRESFYSGTVQMTSSESGDLPSIQRATIERKSESHHTTKTIEFESISFGAVSLDMFEPKAIGVEMPHQHLR